MELSEHLGGQNGASCIKRDTVSSVVRDREKKAGGELIYLKINTFSIECGFIVFI